MLTIMDLRKSFLDYFKERDHKVVASSPLIPKDDPTLLFTTAGMVQFKPMFAGTVELEYTKAATVQKCLRTSDLENVGKTKRHLTFFEMLGNFSFGDYFKKEAIEYSWEYSTEIIGFKKVDIWVSIFQDDDEAFEIWEKHIGVPPEKIIRLGKEDNFWGPAGDTGACGPCSELYLDRGEAYSCGSANCKPGCDCERFLEYWNLVFNQFNQDIYGNLNPLPRTGIDTGMGLERLGTLVQNVDTVFETDEFIKLIEYISSFTGRPYEENNRTSMNIIAEHARALTFAMADGTYPSNEGRGYVLRRILRRALRFTRQLGLKEPFLYTVVDPLVESMGGFYPEIRESKKNVKAVIESEERRFLETLENGMDRLDEVIMASKKSGRNMIPGEEVFVLYDTFGFPVEMTLEIARESGLDVDMEAYEEEMEKQRERGKQSWKGMEMELDGALEELARTCGDTVFLGYEHDYSESTVQGLHTATGIADAISEGEDGLLVLNETPFYGEAGGQVGDTGRIFSDTGAVFQVRDTKKINRTIIHMGSVEKGIIKKGDHVRAQIDSIKRNLTRANHTVTHLLQAALRSTLGEHVKQAGSLVAPDRLRFDFSHYSSLTREEIDKIEDTVNKKIWEHVPVDTEVMNIDEATAKGAIAVFDEKYEDIVRVVQVRDYSMELCGGTHVNNTGEIGLFKILKESSPGAGMRRIEAVTLKGILDRYRTYETIIENLSETLNTAESGIVRKVEDIQARTRALEKEIEKLKKSTLTSELNDIIAQSKEVNGIALVSQVFSDVDAAHLRELADSIRSRKQNSAVFLGSETGGKALLLYAATKPAVDQGIDCGTIIRDTAPIVGGGGGGRKDMAQAGGKKPSSIREAVQAAVQKAEETLT